MQGDLDGLPYSLSENRKYLSLSSNQSLFFFFMYPRTSADIFRMTDFILSYKMAVVESSLQGDIIGYC